MIDGGFYVVACGVSCWNLGWCKGYHLVDHKQFWPDLAPVPMNPPQFREAPPILAWRFPNEAGEANHGRNPAYHAAWKLTWGDGHWSNPRATKDPSSSRAHGWRCKLELRLQSSHSTMFYLAYMSISHWLVVEGGTSFSWSIGTTGIPNRPQSFPVSAHHICFGDFWFRVIA